MTIPSAWIQEAMNVSTVVFPALLKIAAEKARADSMWTLKDLRSLGASDAHIVEIVRVACVEGSDCAVADEFRKAVMCGRRVPKRPVTIIAVLQEVERCAAALPKHYDPQTRAILGWQDFRLSREEAAA